MYAPFGKGVHLFQLQSFLQTTGLHTATHANVLLSSNKATDICLSRGKNGSAIINSHNSEVLIG